MKPEMKKLIIANLPYLLFVYLFGKLGQTYRLAAGADLSEKLLHLADGFSLAFESAAPSFHLFDLAVGVAGAVALRLMVYCKSKNAKKYRRGVESVSYTHLQRKACINSTRRPTLVKSIFILLSFCISTAKQTFSHLHLPRISA